MNARPGFTRTASVLPACLLALCCSAPAVGQGQSITELHALAKQERTLVLWGAGPAVGYERAARAFEERFPGITVSLKTGFSNVLNAQIEEQARTKRIETDVAILQTIQDFSRWKRRGLLLPFRPRAFEAVPTRMKDGDGAWIAVSSNPIFYGYNPDQLTPTRVPHFALDFLQPHFKGRLVSAYPADDDATLFAFVTILRKYGWGFMTHYMTQEPKFVQGHLAVARSIGSGESFASFDTTAGTALAVQQEGGKIALTGPTDDYLPVFFTAEAILKDAPHKNAAKLFVEWYLSPDWQSRGGVYSPRSDVPPPPGLPPLAKYRLEDTYLEFLESEDMLAEVRKRIETYSGPVTNPGDVR